jgi:hypothetical protein
MLCACSTSEAKLHQPYGAKTAEHEDLAAAVNGECRALLVGSILTTNEKRQGRINGNNLLVASCVRHWIERAEVRS